MKKLLNPIKSYPSSQYSIDEAWEDFINSDKHNIKKDYAVNAHINNHHVIVEIVEQL